LRWKNFPVPSQGVPSDRVSLDDHSVSGTPTTDLDTPKFPASCHGIADAARSRRGAWSELATSLPDDQREKRGGVCLSRFVQIRRVHYGLEQSEAGRVLPRCLHLRSLRKTSDSQHRSYLLISRILSNLPLRRDRKESKFETRLGHPSFPFALS
jgi:hypothetical protein